HGTMFTLALVRFPPTATKEIQYLNAKGALTYTDIAGDPVLYGNLPPREISMKDVFRSGDSSKKFKIAEGQWYRYALKVSRLKLPVIWLLVSMWLNTLTKSQIWTLLLKV